MITKEEIDEMIKQKANDLMVTDKLYWELYEEHRNGFITAESFTKYVKPLREKCKTKAMKMIYNELLNIKM